VGDVRRSAASIRRIAGQLVARSRESDVVLAATLTVVFLSAGLISILHHEMWRDEMQAWLIARDSSSIGELFENLRYEGHPALWHLGLYALSRFTRDPTAIQFFHLALAAATTYTFARFSPFTRVQKILFAFGYFPFYEYAVISRNYALGILCIFSFCALFPTRSKGYIPLAVALFFLANTSVYGLMVAVVMGFTLMLDRLLEKGTVSPREGGRLDLVTSLGIFATGIAIAVIQINQSANSQLHSGLLTTLDGERLVATLTAVWRSYVPIPNVFTLHFWNTNILMSGPLKLPGEVCAVLSLALVLAALLLLSRRPVALGLYLAGTVGLLTFTYVTDLGLLAIGSLRHHGHLFVLFLASLWIGAYYPDSRWPDGFMRRLTDVFRHYEGRFVVAMLSVHLVAATVAVAADLVQPFSASKDVSRFIENQQLEALPIVGSRDSAASPVAGFLDRKIYYPESSRFGSFVVWNRERRRVDPRQLLRHVRHLLSIEPEVLLVLNYELDIRAPDLSVVELSNFNHSIVADEHYHLYLLRRKDMWHQRAG
jgi:hypothetical protein